MMEEKISVVVPAYNIEAYIEKTVKSICAQTYVNLEIIIVNDGSKDSTPEIVDRLAEQDARVKVIHKVNGGVTSARLCGIGAATGTWIGFVDGDDYVEPQMYEILMKNAKRYETDISHCGYQMVIQEQIRKYYGTGKVVKQDKNSGLKSLFSSTFFDPGLCNKIYKRSLFDRLLKEDLMDKTIKNNEDLLMNYYLFKEAEFSVFEDLCLYHYQVRENSATQKRLNVNQLLDPLKVTRIIMDEIGDDKDLANSIMPRHVQLLIGLGTKDLRDNKETAGLNQKDAIIELRKNLKKIVMMKECRVKLKVIGFWVAIWPESYRVLRRLSSRNR